jgi:hypothetical protein
MSAIRALFACLCLLSLWPSATRAGVPECGGLRIDDVKSCNLNIDLDCKAGCSELGIYKKACATKLHRVCRQDCTLAAEPTCTDSCTVSCKAQCDRGISITCSHNCFGECRGACSDQCVDAPDRSRCEASCEATCDGECDTKCGAVVDGGCYYHCIECCGGSCTAQANMDCQETCQDEKFEDCEYELKADCSGSCSGSGAVFCGDEFVLSGSDVPGCVTELVKRGLMLDSGEVKAKAEAKAASNLCSLQPGQAARPAWSLCALGLSLGLLSLRRRRL